MTKEQPKAMAKPPVLSILGLAKLKVEGGSTAFDPGAPVPTAKQRAKWAKIAAAKEANAEAKMRAAWAAVDARTDWLPIETAPRDGTWIMLAHDDRSYNPNQYDKEPPMVIGFWEGADDGFWACAHWDGDWRSEFAATKWRPL